MSADELVQAGDVEAALSELQQRVRTHPADSEPRIFLFQLMVVLGQWNRALTQLEVIHDLETKAWPMVHAYRDVINCEMHREAVFTGKSKPLVLGEPQQWMALLIEAQQCYARGDIENFKKLNAQAFEQAPASSGKINDEPFEWLADADQRFGPTLEFIFNEHDYWAPMQTIKTLRTEQPSDLRDLVWLPTEVTWTNGGQNMVMMPARYPRMAGIGNEYLLSRKTDWQDRGQDVLEGIGQRLLATDQSDYPLLTIRSIEFET